MALDLLPGVNIHAKHIHMALLEVVVEHVAVLAGLFGARRFEVAAPLDGLFGDGDGFVADGGKEVSPAALGHTGFAVEPPLVVHRRGPNRPIEELLSLGWFAVERLFRRHGHLRLKRAPDEVGEVDAVALFVGRERSGALAFGRVDELVPDPRVRSLRLGLAELARLVDHREQILAALLHRRHIRRRLPFRRVDELVPDPRIRRPVALLARARLIEHVEEVLAPVRHRRLHALLPFARVHQMVPHPRVLLRRERVRELEHVEQVFAPLWVFRALGRRPVRARARTRARNQLALQL
mmetsp:Transcript_198/g.605  ORF Transcript_198/g.605 Transcript_198/m.605 type:complete len:295 (-) Transcript_198:408-1292(-)